MIWRAVVRLAGGMHDCGSFFVCVHDGGINAGKIEDWGPLRDGSSFWARVERWRWPRTP